MPVLKCPKCDSENVLNDQCLKCGIVVSKYMKQMEEMEEIPPIAPPKYAVPLSPIGAAMKDAGAYHESQAKQNRQARIILLIVFLLLVGIAFLGYRYVKQRASAFGGIYRRPDAYGMHLPDQGWSHYAAGDTIPYGLPSGKDGFYKGDQPDRPDLLLVVYSDYVPVEVAEDPAQIQTDDLKNYIQETLSKKVKDAGYECDFKSMEPVRLPAGKGFVLHAELTRGEEWRQATFYCAFRMRLMYSMLFIGNPDILPAQEDEVEGIGKSLTFTVSPI
ncbi:MAG TPA: hypothetical protein VFG11_10065 [Acidobacteriota bacterium]|nr:hypothetical protein [Acidobacteriota bacterium]